MPRARFMLLFLAWLALPASASFHTFQIEQVFSNADGSVQFVVLHESFGQNGEQFLGGLSFMSSHAGAIKNFEFPKNLPNSGTSGRRFLIATQGFAALGLVTPDYIVPDRFIAVDGGTLNYAGVDQVAYGSLPTDGVTAISRTGAQVNNVATNFAGASGSVKAAPVTNVEFYNASLDHYFISSLAPDIDALDSGRIAGWTRTNLSFKVHPSAASGGADVSPVCRIYIPPPGNSHFFSASPQECADTIAKFPFMMKETDAAFFVALPVTTGPSAGSCPPGTVPVYRVFDNRADPNHRYTTDRSVRDTMVSTLGYIAEGYGNDAVIMCAAG